MLARSGSWKLLRAITLIPRWGDSVIVSHDSAMDVIAREGYYRILKDPDLEIRRRSATVRSSINFSRRHT
jgi:hypothetical protein